MTDFFNKKAFVLGGSGLIGSAVIKKLSKYGCKIVNLDTKNDKKLKCSFLKFDCTNKKIQQNYSKVVKKFGFPDIFINCSYPKTNDWKINNFEKIKLQSLQSNLDKQLTLSSFLIREVAETNRKNKKKCNIVLLSSIYGLVGQDISIYEGTNVTENVSYSIIKGAIISLTKQMCSYYTKFGIRVNNVCPGGVLDVNNKKNSISYNRLLKNYSKRSPIKRMAFPDEIANPIVFLASDDSSYISGISLVVDGGWTSI